jgi:hypothetical protein
MRLKKNFAFGKGKYYFTIKSTPNNITIFRKTKKAAKDAYAKYIKLGKECEWLGQWNGKKFVESNPPVSAA